MGQRNNGHREDNGQATVRGDEENGCNPVQFQEMQ